MKNIRNTTHRKAVSMMALTGNDISGRGTRTTGVPRAWIQQMRLAVQGLILGTLGYATCSNSGGGDGGLGLVLALSGGSGTSGPGTNSIEVTGLVATATNGQINLNWMDPGDPAFDHIEITGGTTANVASGTESYLASGLTNRTSYVFRVKTVDMAGVASAGMTVSASPGVTVTTLAGAHPGADGIGTASRFRWPKFITSDGVNLYVTDSSNNTIRRIVIATGEVTTLAGLAGQSGATNGTGIAARFNRPSGICINNGSLFVTDWNTIRRIVIATGEVTTVAGLARIGGSADGTGSAARFLSPVGIATDGTNLYVADRQNSTIRRIEIATSMVTTFAGALGVSGSVDGTGTAARFFGPYGLVIEGGNLFVADRLDNTIRQIVISTGVVTTLAGTSGSVGSVDATGATARFRDPRGISSDGTNLYVSDFGNNTVRKIVIATGAVTTLAGTAGSAGIVNAVGTAARFTYPVGLSISGGNMYVTDGTGAGGLIRKIIISTAVVSHLAGNVRGLLNATGDGTGAEAVLGPARGITDDGTNLYVTNGHAISRIVIATGAVTTLAGVVETLGSTDGTGATARFYSPQGIATDGANLYVADSGNHTIRKVVIATGVVTTLAGTAGLSGMTNATGTAASFNWPHDVALNGTDLYVSDRSNHQIRKIVIGSGVVTLLAGSLVGSGSGDGIGIAARFFNPEGIASDGTYLYVADNGNQTIRRILIATTDVSTIAGSAGIVASVDGIGTAARFWSPSAIDISGGILYVTSIRNNLIRQIAISTAEVITLAGDSSAPLSGRGGNDGIGIEARFYAPMGIVAIGNELFVADGNNNAIRKVSDL